MYAGEQLKICFQIDQHKLVHNNFMCLNDCHKKNMVFLIAILCNSLRLPLWFNMNSISINVQCVLENIAYFTVIGYIFLFKSTG